MNLLGRFGLVTKSQMQAAILDAVEKAVDKVRDEPEFAERTDSNIQWSAVPPTKTDMIEAFHWSVWLYAAIKKIAFVVMQLRWKFGDVTEDKDGNEIFTPRKDCKTELLFRYPNHQDKFTWRKFMIKSVFSIFTTGNLFGWLGEDEDTNTKGNGSGYKLRVLRPDLVSVKEDRKTGVVEYIYTPTSGKTQKYSSENIVHFYFPSLLDDFEGMSPMNAAWDSIKADISIRRMNRKLVENDFEFGVVLEAIEGMDLSKDMRVFLVDQLKSRYKGPNKVRQPLILPPGIKLNDAASRPSMKDMHYKTLETSNQQSISAAIGTPGMIMGLTGDVNRSNMEEGIRTFYRDEIIPLTAMLADDFNLQIVRIVDKDNPNLRFRWDFSDIKALKEDPQVTATVQRTYVDGGIKTPNEARTAIEMQNSDQPEADLLKLAPAGPELPLQMPAEEQGVVKAQMLELARKNPRDYARWRNAMRLVSPIESKMADDIEKVLRKQETEILAAVEKAVLQKAEMLLPLEKWKAMIEQLKLKIRKRGTLVVAAVEPWINGSVKAGAKYGSGSVIYGFDFNLLDDNVLKFKEQIGKRLTMVIPETTADHFEKTMMKGWEKGESMAQIAERVKSVFGISEEENWRALTIARTETMNAFAFGTHESYKQADIDGIKYWLHGYDDKVREWHLDVKPVEGVDTPFVVGGEEMMYPHDPEGSAWNIINCLTHPLIPIYTSQGWKPVSRVKVGDLVLTHKGRFRKVLRTLKEMPDSVRKYHGEILRISVSHSTSKSLQSLAVTPDHPILTERGMVLAKDLRATDKIGIAAKKCKYCDELIPMVLCQGKRELKLCGSRKCRSTQSREVALGQWATASHRQNVSIKARRQLNHEGEYGIIYLPLKSVTRKVYRHPMPLFNFAVEEDETYVAAGFVTHNCRCCESILPR